ncbi:13946_t:CDS:2 [Dentiscutata heterogama]|uniref:13946_t:CDS:1 n=1 Tax=Dentiscutata heterogama TaxID=1316150 RepID=A0ACA9KD07_9GLOM|nr:13946_t:CDS:2 [Dentiscutata heterogama]
MHNIDLIWSDQDIDERKVLQELKDTKKQKATQYTQPIFIYFAPP